MLKAWRAPTFFGVLAISFLCSGMASQPPSPSPREPSQPQQAEASPTQEQTRSAPSAGDPVAPITKAPPAQHSATEPSKQPSEHDRKAATEWWLMAWTAVLAGVTALLASIAGIQAYLFLRQLRYMRVGMRDATVAARAATRSAVATVAQARLARDTLTKVQRPYVFVYGVKDVEPGPNENIDGCVPYVIANHGQAPAVIDRIAYSLATEKTGPGETGPAWDDHPLVVSPVLGVGVQCPCKAGSVQWLDSGGRLVTSDDETPAAAIPEIKDKSTTWFFRVLVFYRGPFSEGHETSACWRYDRELCQFVQHGGKEYNYTK